MGKGDRIPASYGQSFKLAAQRINWPPDSPRFRVTLETPPNAPGCHTTPENPQQPITLEINGTASQRP